MTSEKAATVFHKCCQFALGQESLGPANGAAEEGVPDAKVTLATSGEQAMGRKRGDSWDYLIKP